MNKSSFNYQSWEIKEEDYPENASFKEKMEFFIGYGILAPSTHNTQPWLFQINRNTITVLPDWRYRLPSGDKEDHDLLFSLGCATENIVCTANHYGYETHVKINSPSKKATRIVITFNKSIKSNHTAQFFRMIPKRHSLKVAYENKKIEKIVLNKLKKIKLESGIKLVLVDNSKMISGIAELQGGSVRALKYDKSFKDELYHWFKDTNTKDFDGMPGFVIGLKQPAMKIFKFMLKNASFFMNIIAKKEKKLLATSPVIGLIISNDDTIQSAVYAGMSYERLMLALQYYEISTAPMAATLKDKNLPKLKSILNLGNSKCHLLFRMGYTDKDPFYHTPRRKVSQVILH